MDMTSKTDSSTKTSFSAMVVFNDSQEEETFDVELGTGIDSLTYDEVVDAIYEAVDAKHGYGPEDFDGDAPCPYRIEDIVVNEGGESYPVVAEDADISDIIKSTYIKYLVLPWAKYTLTPECKLWMKLKESGIIDEDEPFDYEKMHELAGAADIK